MKKSILLALVTFVASASFAQAPEGVRIYEAQAKFKNQSRLRPDKNKVERPVPFQVPNPTVTASANRSGGGQFGREIIGNTFYDLQTNSSVGNRIVRNSDGTIAAVWTMSPTPSHSAFFDRGTGYNFRNSLGWDNLPSSRIESSRIGWPSVINPSNGTEAVICHNTTQSQLQISKRANRGVGLWNEDLNTFSSPSVDGNWWPKMVTGGINGNSIHVLSITYPVASGGSIYQGIDGALLYSRSQDGGLTWDKMHELIPDLDASNFIGFGGDTYAIDARGNTVAILVGDATQDLVLLKSTDNGNTWTKTIVEDFPIDLWDYNAQISDINGDGTADTLETHDGAMAVLIDNNNQVHVFTGYMRILEDDPATAGYSYFPYTDGIKYWNESMGSLSPVIITSAVDRDGSGVIEYPTASTAGALSVGSTGNSISSYPSAGITPGGKIFLTYSSIFEGTDNGEGKSYRHQYLIVSENGGNSWSAPLDLIPASGDPDFTEGTFGAIARRVDIAAHIIYQEDAEPGHSMYGPTPGDADPGNINQLNNIVYNAVDTIVFSLPVGIENEGKKGEISVFPNPANDRLTVSVSAAQTEDYYISIYDISGRLVSSLPSSFNGFKQSCQIDLREFSPGVYRISAQSASQNISAAFIKH